MTSAAGTGLSKAEFERFREYFYKRTGIRFAETKRYFVDKRIDASRPALLTACKFESPLPGDRRGGFGELGVLVRREVDAIFAMPASLVSGATSN